MKKKGNEVCLKICGLDNLTDFLKPLNLYFYTFETYIIHKHRQRLNSLESLNYTLDSDIPRMRRRMIGTARYDTNRLYNRT